MNRFDINQQRQCMGCMEFYDAAYDICPHCGYEDGQGAVELLHIDPGTLLANRYIIGRALGYGGFGVTYLAWDTQLKRKLAIKEYLPSEFATRMIHHQDLIVANNEKKHQQYKDGMKKFLQEGQKLAQVSNIDGIVHMYDCFEANNTAYITMEYLEGETLAAFLDREGKIGEQQAMDYILPVMEALETVHEKGIIHRDIAPDNIFLSRDASGELKVKLIDFGAAKFATTSHSKSLTVIIKPGYSPEEQYRSKGDQGTYTDVYALAAVLYRMVTGVQPPDAFERRTMIESKKRDLLEEPSKYNRELSANFENALLNAMNVRIEDRTATIAEFEEELISFEPVKRRGSSIRRIDFMRWPLWAKIGVPVGSVAALALLIWGLIAVFTNPVTSYELPEGMTRVPDFVTADFEKAQQWADEAVLLIGSTGTEYVPNAAENVVLRQDVYSGAVVLENTMVSVVVSTGEESYYLPDVTGMEIEAARKALECMGLEIVVTPCGQVNGLAANCVVSQDIEPYTVVKTGDTITINVTDSGSSTDGTACKLTGLGYSEALEAAAGAGAVIRVTGRVFTDDCTAPQIQSQSVAEGTAIIAGTVIDVTVAVPMRQFTMPNLLYKSQETAKQLLKNIGIDATVEGAISEIIAKGLVAEQSIEKEQTVMPGEQVTLVVSSGSKPFAMPDVAGKTEEEARRILTESTLVVSAEYDYDQTVPEGSVIRQSVKAGADVTRGTEVKIVICSTEGLILVTDVKGMDAEAARKTLEASGLKVMIEEVYGTDEDAGKVISQLPAAASYQKPDTTVVLTVSKGAKRTTVPNVVGMSRSEATAVLKNAGFAVKTTEEYSSVGKGKVISQSPDGGSSQKDGTTITIRVSIGSKPAETQPPKETQPPVTPQPPAQTQPPKEPEKPKEYKVSWSNGTGYTITVKRTSSPNANAPTGTLNSGATVYHGDVLSVTYTKADYYTITSKGAESITVTGNVTSAQIYATAQQNAVSGWVKASEVPSGAQIVSRKWAYTETVTTESRETSLDGYTQTGSYWVESGHGSTNYASFPGGFDTGHSIYTSFAKDPYSAYEDATSKREVSNNWAGYVYWHWMYNTGTSTGYLDRAIYYKYGYPTAAEVGPTCAGFLYQYFQAFTSTSNYGAVYQNWNQGDGQYLWYNCTGVNARSSYFYRFSYHTSSYTDYYKVFQYQKTEDKESTTEVTAGGAISNVQEWVQYRAK